MEQKILRNRYQIIKKLGSGGFGTTFQAQDLDLPSQPICVVKQFQPIFTQKEILTTAKRLFDQEAKVLYRLGHHDQIPRLLAHFEQDNEFYLVQDLIAGQSLDLELTGKRWDEAQVLQLLHDLLKVLAFVHTEKVIHRDIKPANLMRRSSDGKIILIDFGAVKEVSTQAAKSHGKTDLTVVVGSPGYMPSEQNDGRPQFSSDIYAVGMVCLQGLSGLPCQEFPKNERGEYNCETLPGIVEISPGLAAMINRMVLYDYRDRFYDANEALQTLEAIINNTPTIPTPVIPTASPIPPSLPLEEPEGLVSLNSPFYINLSSIETDCYQAVTKPAALIRIKAPRQMGKSSLMFRILNYAAQQSCQTVSLNLQSADASCFTSLDLFLQWFCAIISDELSLPEQLDQYWSKRLGSKSNCTKYFQRYILTKIPHPIVLGLDEVDQIFPHPQIATDFFGLLRAWHEQGKNTSVWQQLRLIIVHSKEVYIPLNINQSPFNVGLPIELPQLDSAQVKDLVQRHHLNWSREQIEQLMAMVGGHPHLVRVALYQIAKGRMTLGRLLHIAPTESGPYGNHLHTHLVNLEENPQLLAAMRDVVNTDQPLPIGATEGFQLHSMGLIKFQGNSVEPLCGLYRHYLRDRLRIREQ